MRIFNAVDFDDLIVLPVHIFELHPDLASSYRETYRYAMIDEFQDTSFMQYRFMSIMSSSNLCVVGDDDQSIYSWRGANFENFGLFERDFPGSRK